jgi:hypothetical protein
MSNAFRFGVNLYLFVAGVAVGIALCMGERGWPAFMTILITVASYQYSKHEL